MKEKRKSNSHKEKHEKQAFKRNISERLTDHPQFEDDLGHLEEDTIFGIHHKNTVITLVERDLKKLHYLEVQRAKSTKY